MKSSKQQAIELAKQEEFWKALNCYGTAIPDNIKFSLANDFHKIVSKEYDNWIKIESEKDLPSENIDCFYVVEVPSHYDNAGTKINIGSFKFGRNIMSGQENYFTVDNFFFHRFPFVTHYQPITKPEPPIF